MTLTTSPDALPHESTPEQHDRFRLHRAGILNVWQYDDQEFHLADGRLLLRGANGAGKSKTMEILLPFALDGDKARITASAKHHTSLLWLMTDGYDGQARVGYVWVEFLRPTTAGEEVFTCGVGIRSSASAKTASTWFFSTTQRIGHDLALEDEAGPLSRPRLAEAVGDAGQVFDKAAAYKEHVGRTLFGLDVPQYDEVLRLLYWLRQPQVGEDIEPTRLTGQLAQALPQLDDQAVRTAGDTFDELTAFGEQIARRAAAAEGLATLAGAYARYARGVVAGRGRAVRDAVTQERRLRRQVDTRVQEHADLQQQRADTEAALTHARARSTDLRGRIEELQAGPEARDQRRLADLEDSATTQARDADEAEQHAHALTQRHEEDRRRQTAETDRLTARLSELAGTQRELEARQQHCGVGVPVPVPAVLDSPELDQESGPRVRQALTEAGEAVSGCAQGVSQRQGAVRVVQEALTALAEADRKARTEEERAEEAERHWEGARAHRHEAEEQVTASEEEFRRRWSGWVAEDAAPDPATPGAGADESLPGEAAPALALPAELTPEILPTLAGLADAVAQPTLDRLRGEHQQQASLASQLAERIADLEERQARIEAETDPAPPSPALARSERTDGAGLWRVVDFAEGLAEQERTGVEAAVQASGLLDAWLRPDGQLLQEGSYDVLLAAGPVAAGERSLAEVLRPDLPEESDLTAATVDGVLRRVGLRADADQGDAGEGAGPVAVGLDGSWRLEPLRGRAAKPQAQYVGATARAQERARRLAEVEQELSEQRHRWAQAHREQSRLADALAAVEDWVRRRPRPDALAAAWTRVEERRTAETAAEEAHGRAQARARQTREAAAEQRRTVDDLAVRHDLTAQESELDALEQRLRTLAADLRHHERDTTAVDREVQRWVADEERLTAAAATVTSTRERASQRRQRAEETANRLTELRRTVGASVAALEERLTGLRAELTQSSEDEERSREEARRLTGREGAAEERVGQARSELGAHLDTRTVALTALAATVEVPGLIEAAFADADTDSPDRAALAAAGGIAGEDPVPQALVTAAGTCADRADAVGEADVTGVWKAYTEVSTGPAGDHDPRVSEFGDLLAVTASDDGGEAAITELAARVEAAVTADRELLTTREKERFEQHVLGELGDAIRRCRMEADELVGAMNRLLDGVSTSQGITVKLDWKLREDIPHEAGEAVRLLGQPVGALLPHERTELREALHRLIEASRAERPELSYAEHLAAALDYREWYAFRIRYSRPEQPGEWLQLHRRSALSQGEQKVLCYLPLFAAAAAHFTSLAGAAPYAPRLVLLDDAFPKIDVRTHPLLFGLLVDLDLDFVITSERLWGDHETVPSLAIYEALRDPAHRGIAQFQYRWDGRQLRSLG